MDIYAIFNTETGVYQAALIQGEEENGGQFDSFGDERFEQASQIKNLFTNSSDWILISEEDFAKYKLGTHGGDNDTGYLYDFATGLPISAPPIEKTYEQEIAEVTADYKVKTDSIKDDYLTAVLIDDDTSAENIAECKQRFQAVTEEDDNKIRDIIDKYFDEKED